jgi:hypothetical protein
MTIQHKDIPDAERHEPKGVSTASDGTVYQADGAGSGSWEIGKVKGQASAEEGMILRANGSNDTAWVYAPEGWAHYRESGAGQVITTTASKVLIDGAAAKSTSAYLPYQIRGTGQLWNVTTSKITPINTGDTYDLRIDIPVTAESGAPTELKLELDIGTGAGITDSIVTIFKKTGRTTPYQITMSFPIFVSADFKANGGQIFLKTDAGTVTCGEIGLTLVRNVDGSF